MQEDFDEAITLEAELDRLRELVRESLDPAAREFWIKLGKHVARLQSKDKRGTRIDPAMKLSADMLEDARQIGVLAVDMEFAGFVDYWISRPGKEGLKLNWEATWRTWCRRATKGQDKQIAAQQATASGWERVRAYAQTIHYTQEPYPIDTPETYETRARIWANQHGVRT